MIVTIASQKGGVGKTTTALNLGYCLSLTGCKVLIIDGDPQGGVAASLNLKKKTPKGLVHALRGDIPGDGPIIRFNKGFFAVAANGIVTPEDIPFYEDQAQNGSLGSLIRIMSRPYDFTVIDSPVGIGGTVRSFLEISDSYIPVVNCHSGTVKSLPKLVGLAEWLTRNLNKRLVLEGVLINMLNEQNPSEMKIYNHFRSRFPEDFFFNTVIPFDTKFETAAFKGIPLSLLDNAGNNARPFRELTREVLGNKYRRDKGSDKKPHHKDPSRLEQSNGPDKSFQNSPLDAILSELCSQENLPGALIADEMGFPLAEHNPPIESESLAAFSSVLSDTLKKASSILGQAASNSISLDISDHDKIVMRRFEVLRSPYFLLAVCPRKKHIHPAIDRAVSKIKTELSG